MRPAQAPAYYSCVNSLQIVGHINVQNIFDINSPQRTTLSDLINSQSPSSVRSPIALLFATGIVCVGFLMSVVSLSLSHDRHQLARQHLCARAQSWAAVQRAEVWSSGVQSCARRRRHVPLVGDGRLRQPAGRRWHTVGEGGHSSVCESVHDE